MPNWQSFWARRAGSLRCTSPAPDFQTTSPANRFLNALCLCFRFVSVSLERWAGLVGVESTLWIVSRGDSRGRVNSWDEGSD